MKIDLLDRRVLDLMMQNAYQSNGALARQLGVNAATVRRRVKKLIQGGMARIIAVPDPRKLGTPLRALIAFDVANDSMDSVMTALSTRAEVKWLAATTGRFDVIASVWLPSTSELLSFMKEEVGKLEGIRNAEIFLCLRVQKGI
ncbi:MAG: Lrp/AsnC family transcriptional regulator [Chloroflexi bacterium]|nr:Lrp/AsnC family transcriptional regulator [Chloroflexota bacterium]